MNYGLPAGCEDFRLCPTPGCDVRVWSPINRPQKCRAHGGEPAFSFRETDEWGEYDSQQAEQPVPPPAVPAAFDLGRIED